MRSAKFIVCGFLLVTLSGQQCLLPPASMVPPQAGNFAGAWQSTYECTNTGRENFQGGEFLVVTQNGADATITDQNGFQFAGMVSGADFTWSGAGFGYTESGTWTLLADGSVSKSTQYQGSNGSGECVGTLVRDADGMPGAP